LWEVGGLERGPLSLMITTEELLEKRSSDFGLESVGIRCADHVTPSTRKSRHYFADSDGRSIGILRLRTKATEFSFFFLQGKKLKGGTVYSTLLEKCKPKKRSI
jgi:hypothetical protein